MIDKGVYLYKGFALYLEEARLKAKRLVEKRRKRVKDKKNWKRSWNSE